MKVALTHGPERFEGLAEALAQAGHEVVVKPLITVRPREACLFHRAGATMLELPWLLFPSRSAVEAWRSLGLPLTGPLVPLLGALGPGTARALREAGGDVRVQGEPATALGLADAFLADAKAAGPVGLPHGDRALPTLRRALERAGYEVRPLVVYETVAQRFDPVVATADVTMLASPSAVAQVPDGTEAHTRFLAVGPTTATALADRGWSCEVAEEPTVSGVLEAVVRMARDSKVDVVDRGGSSEAEAHRGRGLGPGRDPGRGPHGGTMGGTR